MNKNNFHTKKIIYLGPENFVTLIKSFFQDYQVFFFSKVEELDNNLNDATIIIDASLEINFNKERLTKANKLRIFAAASTGFTHVDSDELNNRGIKLISLKGKRDFLKTITPAAEHSWLLLMLCARKIRSAILDIEKDIWERTRYPGLLLKGKTLGIIGVGRIGGWMARYAEAFGMECLGYDPYPVDLPKHITMLPLKDLVENSDFISLHVNYDKSLEKFISSDLIKNFKKGSIFINTSRGELVDEDALITAFLDGRIVSIGLDVLTNERNFINSKIYKLAKKNPEIIITPHIGGYSPEVLPIVLEYISKEVKSELLNSR